MGAALALSLLVTNFSLEAAGPGGLGRLCRALCRICPRQCALAAPARSAGDVRARRHRADRPDHRDHDAAHLCRRIDKSSDAGRQPAGHRPRARARLGGLCRLMSTIIRLLAAWLNYGYAMIRWPIFAIPVVLAATGRYRPHRGIHLRVRRGAGVTTMISALVPAIGVYQQIGLDPATLKHINPRPYLDQLRDLPPTREGVLRHLDLLNLGGIVTFPSFHAASAFLYAWALWPVRWLRPIVIAGERRHAGGDAGSMAAIISSTSSPADLRLRSSGDCSPRASRQSSFAARPNCRSRRADRADAYADRCSCRPSRARLRRSRAARPAPSRSVPRQVRIWVLT